MGCTTSKDKSINKNPDTIDVQIIEVEHNSSPSSSDDLVYSNDTESPNNDNLYNENLDHYDLFNMSIPPPPPPTPQLSTQIIQSPTIQRLNNINTDDIPYFTWEGKQFKSKPCNIYDGDTLSMCWIDNGRIIKYRFRCLGYDSPEMRPLKSLPNRDEEIRKAKLAKERLTELVTKMPYVTIHCGKFDKYGRILANIYNGVDEKSVNDIMVEEGHGYEYFGGTKKQ